MVEESSLELMDIFAEPLLVEGGLTVLSDDAVGSGISWNLAYADAYRIKGVAS